MFDDIVVSKEGNKVKTVKRVSTEARVKGFTHHPTKIMPVVQLGCSCGYEGLLPVPVDFGSEDSEPVECPNCHSLTVHPKHVTELPTTIVHFHDGSTHNMVGNHSDESPEEKTNKVEPGLNAVEVKKLIDESLDAKFEALFQKLKPVEQVSSSPATSEKGGN